MRPSPPSLPIPAPAPAAASYFALLAGLFLTLNLVKWGNPVILDSKVEAPASLIEIIFMSWPTEWAFWLMIPLVVLGVVSFSAKGDDRARIRSPGAKSDLKVLKWAVMLPLIWLCWQFLSATQTVDAKLTYVTMRHFAACVLFFYLGFVSLRGTRNYKLIWLCLTLGLICVIRAGFDQHFGGIEATRRFFYQQPNWHDFPADYIKKVNSNRIFGTLCYPNSLAGLLLLLLPLALTFLWMSSARLPVWVRRAVVAVVAALGGACLYWSGSKAGWLLAVVVGMVALWHSGLNMRWKRGLIFGLLVAGLAGFGLRYAGFFQKGSTSVVARFDYWSAALQTAKSHPLLGSGPGTFFVQYMKLKSPDSEVTRLCHNDYLEQASDSGLPGCLAFSGFVLAALFVSYRFIRREASFDPMKFAVWLGLLGLSLHWFVDFHLYIPALAWTAFFLFGWMLARVREAS